MIEIISDLLSVLSASICIFVARDRVLTIFVENFSSCSLLFPINLVSLYSVVADFYDLLLYLCRFSGKFRLR